MKFQNSELSVITFLEQDYTVLWYVTNYKSNNNLTLIMRLKHAMQTQRCRLLHIDKTYDQTEFINKNLTIVSIFDIVLCSEPATI